MAAGNAWSYENDLGWSICPIFPLMAESIYWSNGNIQMIPRKDGEVGEGWFVIISVDGLEQIKSIESNLFLQKKLIRSKYEDSVLKDNQIISTVRI